MRLSEYVERVEKSGFVAVDSDRTDEFSVRPCECCASELYGERYRGWQRLQVPTDTDGGFEIEFVAGDVCVDCLFYLANGELPGPGGVIDEEDEEA